MTTTEIIAFGGLAMNAGAIIWGAAKLSSAVDHLKELVTEVKDKTIPEIKEIAMNVQDRVHGIVARIYIIEKRLDIEYRAEDHL